MTRAILLTYVSGLAACLCLLLLGMHEDARAGHCPDLICREVPQ